MQPHVECIIQEIKNKNGFLSKYSAYLPPPRPTPTLPAAPIPQTMFQGLLITSDSTGSLVQGLPAYMHAHPYMHTLISALGGLSSAERTCTGMKHIGGPMHCTLQQCSTGERAAWLRSPSPAPFLANAPIWAALVQGAAVLMK